MSMSLGTMGRPGSLERAVKLGTDVSLISINSFTKFFPGLTVVSTIKMLKDFGIPIIYIGKTGYFNQYTLETVFKYLTGPNRKNFALPGSSRKKQIGKKGPVPDTLTSLGDQELFEMNNLGGNRKAKKKKKKVYEPPVNIEPMNMEDPKDHGYTSGFTIIDEFPSR